MAREAEVITPVESTKNSWVPPYEALIKLTDRLVVSVLVVSKDNRLMVLVPVLEGELRVGLIWTMGQVLAVASAAPLTVVMKLPASTLLLA